MKVKQLKWTSETHDNIETHHARIGKTIYFAACRFKDDNWILTSYVTPMPMMHPQDIETCKLLSQAMLDGFVQHLTDEKND